VTRTADYLHQVSGNEYLIEVVGVGHAGMGAAGYVQVSLKDAVGVDID
jgi:UDP-N-acetyl-D-mannosaminuronate dehydrogenase